MTIFNDNEYSKGKVHLELINAEIDCIIEELERCPHNIFEFLNYKEIISKLKNAQEKINSPQTIRRKRGNTSPMLPSEKGELLEVGCDSETSPSADTLNLGNNIHFIQKDELKERKCNRCKKKYKGYNILICDCSDCFVKFLLINSIYGRHLCKECREEVNFPFTKRDFEQLKQQLSDEE